MKKNNLILGAFLVITAIFFSGCGASSSSDSTSTEKVEGSTESTSSPSVSNSTEKVIDSSSTEKVESNTESAESLDVVTFGNQVWTSKNLDVSTYSNGDVIPEVQDKFDWKQLTTGAWCYYDNDASNGTESGKLYNWYAVNDPRGLAPKGYHIPSDAEWTTLSVYFGEMDAEGLDKKIKSSWITSGFSGLPNGERTSYGACVGFDDYSSWWSSMEHSTYLAYARTFYYTYGDVVRVYTEKKEGNYVRCLRD